MSDGYMSRKNNNCDVKKLQETPFCPDKCLHACVSCVVSRSNGPVGRQLTASNQ